MLLFLFCKNLITVCQREGRLRTADNGQQTISFSSVRIGFILDSKKFLFASLA